MGTCRDCRICTRREITKLLLLLPRLLMLLTLRWNVGLFRKRCPVCGHLLTHHERRADGSFKD
jgi:hypothetical protein